MEEFFGPENDQWLGETIEDRYEIKRYIQAGGMGVVYEGLDTILNRRVAIKRLHTEYARQKGALERFRREAQAASKVGNEHIIQVFDMVFPPDLQPFMVMEYLDGVTLEEDIIDNEPQPLGRIARIVIQICDALEEVHNRGIVHRDLKPGNVFLITQGANPDFVKVLDFGIAMVKSTVAGHGLLKKVTDPGQIIGTPEYMSPEQVEGRADIDWRTDIYALGAILFFALTANPPLSADALAVLLLKICEQPVPSIRTFRTDLPVEIDAIIRRAMAKNRDERFADAREMKNALWSFLDKPLEIFSNPPPAIQPSSFPPPPPSWNSSSSPSGPPLSAPDSVPPGVLPSAVESTPPVPHFALWPWALAVAFASALLAFGAIMVIRKTDNGESDSAITHPASPLVRTSEQSIHRDPTESERVLGREPPETVQIEVTTEPSGSDLYLDGNRVSSPFDVFISKNGKKYKLEAKKSGYRDEVRYIDPQDDTSIYLSLKRTARVSAAVSGRQKNPSQIARIQEPSLEGKPDQKHRPENEDLSTTDRAVTPATPRGSTESTIGSSSTQPIITPEQQPSQKRPSKPQFSSDDEDDVVPNPDRRNPLGIPEE